MPTPGPGELSLCQNLGLAASASEAGLVETIPATPQIQSSEFTGQYPDIEFLPVYPGSVLNQPDPFRIVGAERGLSLIAPGDINSVVQFYIDALSKNGWASSYYSLTPNPKYDGTGGLYYWTDPSNALPW